MKKSEMDRIYAMFKEEFPEPIVYSCSHNYMHDDGLWVCCKCHRIERLMVEPFVEYKDRPITSIPYDKCSHFKQKMDEISGHSMLIPNEVMQVCLGTEPEVVKMELQRHKLKKYYSCVYLILRQKGIKIPTLLQSEKDRLIQFFKRVEIIYATIKKKNNLISYHFILSKLLPMIGRQDLVPWLFKLHSKRKIKEYDLLWSKILDKF
jgi:hypothetical protein